MSTESVGWFATRRGAVDLARSAAGRVEGLELCYIFP